MNDNDKTQQDQPATNEPQAASQAATADAAGGSDPTLALTQRVIELESQIADLTDRLLRAHADMENVRKRTEREKIDGAKYAISKFALDIVGISDNFQRAVAAVPAGTVEQEGPLKSVVEGVLMTERAFLQVLERHGVKRVDPQGEPFNPNFHQAVMEQENASVPAGSVLQVFQPGFLIEERVLRPAMVVVARGGVKVQRPAEAQAQPPAGNMAPPLDNATGQGGAGQGGAGEGGAGEG